VYSLSLTTKTMTIIAASALLAGCATAPSDISAAYVSPVLYQNYTCQQLSMEAQSVSARAAQVAGVQENKRTNDAVATGVAIVLFWPAAFLVKGDGPTAAELGQLKGQMMAIEQANIAKRCGLQFNRGN
jgi:low temperature requirement protein LtrA